MTDPQYKEAFVAARQTALENTPTNRPSATDINPLAGGGAEKTEEELKRYTSLYFGYASNLSPRTMKQRCPDSLFISLGKLKGWRWMINETGYANIVPGEPDDEVWGSLCFLSFRDEVALDESEGVPWIYQKLKLKVRRIPTPTAGQEWNTGDEGEEVEATAYCDIERVTEGRIEKDYVVWVKKAIRDAKLCGMPESYAEKYLTKYLPPDVEGGLPEQEINMVRTIRFGEETAGLVPRGFASWSRG